MACEAHTVRAFLDALIEACLARDLACELRDVDAQAVGRVQARVDVPDVGNRVEPTCLDGNGLQDVGREIGQRIPQLVGDHPLNGLQPFRRRCRRNDVPLQQIIRSSHGATRGRAGCS